LPWIPPIHWRPNYGSLREHYGRIAALRPAPDDALRMWPVSRRVSKPGNGDDSTLIEPIVVHASTEPTTLIRLN
jgi:hypothetical protein